MVALFNWLANRVGMPAPGNPSPTPAPAPKPDDKKTQGSPLAPFEKMWQPPEPTDGKQKQEPFKVSLDPAKLREAVGKIDLVKAIDPKVLADAAKGNTDALALALNAAAQAGIEQSMMASANILNTALEANRKEFQDTVLPEALRKAQTRETVGSTGKLKKITNEPALAPLVDLVASQIASTNPNATQAEIAEHTQLIFDHLAGIVAPQTETPAQGNNIVNPAPAKEMDWQGYFGETPTPSSS